jgi:hypothetical protein
MSKLADFMNMETMAQPTKAKSGGNPVPMPTSPQRSPEDLHEGDFLIPADVVSMIGDGSTDAGMKSLDMMMTKILGEPYEGSLKGEGGGLSDMIPQNVKNKDGTVAKGGAQVANGEYQVPEVALAKLGDGDPNKGATVMKRLIDKIRSKKQGGEQKQAGSINDILKG